MTTENRSPWDDERVTAYVMKELSPSDRSLFEQEMANDPTLADAVEQARSVTDQLSTLFAAEATPGLSKRHRAAIINEPVITRLEDEPRGRTALIAFLAIAACALAVIGLTPLMQSDQVAMVQSDTRELNHPETSEVEAQSKIARRALQPGSYKFPEGDILEVQQPEFAVAPTAGQLDAAIGGLDYDTIFSEQSASLRAAIQERSGGKNRNKRNSSGARLADLYQGDSILATIELDEQLVPLMTERDKYAAEFGESHPVVMRLDAELSSMNSKLKKRGHLQTERVMNLEDSVGGRGRDISGDRFEPIIENGFTRVADHPLSTFSADVDTASYSKVRDYLLRAQQWPRPDAVRIEEMINYFDYADDPPADDADHPFAAGVTITECPWKPEHRLARIAIKGKTLKPKQRPDCNLVFLLDTSGSMNADNKLPLVIDGMKMLTNQLTKNDRVAIVVYAGSAGLVLESTSAKQKKKIRRALNQLSAGGSTNGGQGITLAYQTAREHFIEGGVNRVILCTDGDFNVGTTGTDSLVRMVEKEAKDNVFLTVLGFGMGNHNDAMLEKISGRGNGNYAFIDNPKEARKVLVKQAAGTLVTVAKDVKLQVDFNPARVGAYRLIGYENRRLATQDFNDDTKDAGEIGAGHSVTALYELVPPDRVDQVIQPAVDKSKYAATDAVKPKKKQTPSQETLTVRIRYKQPDSDTSTRVDFPATDDGQSFEDADVDARFTAAVAGLGMLLRGSQHSGVWEYSDVIETAKSALGRDLEEQRAEFLQMAQQAKRLSGN